MTGKLHIVYDVSYPSVEGGGQKRIYEIAKRLAMRGWTIRWFTFKTWEGPSNIERDGIGYVGLDGYVSLYAADGRRSWREALAFGCAVWTHRHVIRDADVLWCGQWPYLHLLPLLYGSRAACFIDWWEIWGKHWFEYFGWSKGTVGFICERLHALTCSRKSTIITVSPQGARDVIKAGASRKVVITIPNGIDFSKIDRCQRLNDRIDIIYVGRLKDHKNVDHLIHAVHLLRVNYNCILHAVIIGDGPEKQALQRLSKDLEVDQQIRFLGALDEEQKYAYLKSAAVFVHPSTKEGGGSITLFESHACGTPAIIYRAPQGIDVGYISEGTTGWVVNGITPTALAACLAKLFADNQFRFRMREHHCRTAALHYDWGLIAEDYERIFLSRYANSTNNLDKA